MKKILHRTKDELNFEIWEILGHKNPTKMTLWGDVEVHISKDASGFVKILPQYTDSTKNSLDLVGKALEMDFGKEYSEELIKTCWFKPPHGVLSIALATPEERTTSWLQAYHKFKGKEVTYMLKGE